MLSTQTKSISRLILSARKRLCQSDRKVDCRMQVERETNETPSNTKDKLKINLPAVFTDFKEDTVGKACRRFQSCNYVQFQANNLAKGMKPFIPQLWVK